MITLWTVYVCGMAVVAYGLVAGVFLTFSDFVMPSLKKATPASGIQTMQIINKRVFSSAFLILLMGMAFISLILSVIASFIMTGPATLWIITGSMTYFIGVYLVTMLCNVPLNKKLAIMDHTAPETAFFWQTYVSYWTNWNHIRTLASTIAMACFLVAFYYL